MRSAKILVWVDRIVIAWASFWFIYALWQAALGHYASAIVGFIVHGAALALFTQVFYPKDKATLQAEKDRRILDSLDW